MRFLRDSCLALLASWLCAASLHAQAVHVLSNGTGSALQAVIDAAGEGDTILLHAGSFVDVHLPDKTLTLVSEPFQSTTIQKLDVTGLSSGKRVVLSGLRLLTSDASLAFGVPVFPVPALKITNCAGSVRVQDIALVPFVADSGADAVQASNSTDVAFLSCQVFGGHQRGPNVAFNGAQYFGPGIGFSGNSNTRVALYDSDVRGGNGANALLRGTFGSPNLVNATAGARGITLTTGNAFVANSLATGGSGGFGVGSSCVTACGNDASAGAAGGSGIESTGAQTLVVNVLALGGAAGLGGGGATCSGGSCPPPGVTHPPGANGAPGAPTAGTVLAASGPVANLFAPLIVREQQVLTVVVNGTPGDFATLAVSQGSRWIESTALQGVYLFGPDVRRLDLGLVPAGGMLTINLSSGTLPPGVDTATRILQVATRDPLGVPRLGGARVVTIVRQGF